MILPIFSDQCPHFWNVEYHLSIVTGDDFANDVVILQLTGAIMLIGSKLRQIFSTLVMGCKPLASQFISCSVPFVQPLLSRSMRDPCAEKTHCLTGWPIGFLLKLYPSYVSSHIYTCVYVM